MNWGCWSRVKFDFRKLLTLFIGSFLIELFFEPNGYFFQKGVSSLEIEDLYRRDVP